MREQALKVLDSLRAGKILGVEFENVEMLGEEPDRELFCQVFADTGNFMPFLLYTEKLSELEVASLLHEANIQWTADDFPCEPDGTPVPVQTSVRFFSVSEKPNAVRWMKKPNPAE